MQYFFPLPMPGTGIALSIGQRLSPLFKRRGEVGFMKHWEQQPICLRIVEEGIAIPKYCIWQFNCHRCAFSQWLDNTAVDAGMNSTGIGHSPKMSAK